MIYSVMNNAPLIYSIMKDALLISSITMDALMLSSDDRIRMMELPSRKIPPYRPPNLTREAH